MTGGRREIHDCCSNFSFLQIFNLEYISCWKQQRQNAVIFSNHVYWIYEFYETSITSLGEACISISISCYDWNPASAQNCPQTIHTPAVDAEISIIINMKEKIWIMLLFSLSPSKCLSFLNIRIWKRTNASSSEITLHCFFSKGPFSKGFVDLELEYNLIFFSPPFQTILESTGLPYHSSCFWIIYKICREEEGVGTVWLTAFKSIKHVESS